MVTAFGDSKTEGDTWPELLASSLCGHPTLLADIALGGTTALYWSTNLAAALASYSGTPTHVLVNMGINDAHYAYDKTSFKGWYATILDAFHAKWPAALIYCTNVWARSDFVTAGNLVAINEGIDEVIADGRTAWAKVGDDERVWYEGGDDGATMTTDGIHPSAAGETAAAAAKKTAMGF